MKKFQFLLLDAGPIIKLFELGIWDRFIKECDVTISRTVAEDEVVFASGKESKEYIDLTSYEKQDSIRIVDVSLQEVKKFHDGFDLQYKADIHAGEKETLAFLCQSKQHWMVCAADGAVFRVLGLLGKADCGISLEEILNQIGLSRQLEFQYTKKFREKHTHIGQADALQERGFG